MAHDTCFTLAIAHLARSQLLPRGRLHTQSAVAVQGCIRTTPCILPALLGSRSLALAHQPPGLLQETQREDYARQRLLVRTLSLTCRLFPNHFFFSYDGAHAKEMYVGWKEREGVCRAPVLLHPIKVIVSTTRLSVSIVDFSRLPRISNLGRVLRDHPRYLGLFP